MSLFEKYWQNPRAKRSSMLQMQPLIDARIASRKELGLPPLEEEMQAPMQVPAGVLRHTVLVASSWTMVSTVMLCYLFFAFMLCGEGWTMVSGGRGCRH